MYKLRCGFPKKTIWRFIFSGSFLFFCLFGVDDVEKLTRSEADFIAIDSFCSDRYKFFYFKTNSRGGINKWKLTLYKGFEKKTIDLFHRDSDVIKAMQSIGQSDGGELCIKYIEHIPILSDIFIIQINLYGNTILDQKYRENMYLLKPSFRDLMLTLLSLLLIFCSLIRIRRV